MPSILGVSPAQQQALRRLGSTTSAGLQKNPLTTAVTASGGQHISADFIHTSSAAATSARLGTPRVTSPRRCAAENRSKPSRPVASVASSMGAVPSPPDAKAELNCVVLPAGQGGQTQGVEEVKGVTYLQRALAYRG